MKIRIAYVFGWIALTLVTVIFLVFGIVSFLGAALLGNPILFVPLGLVCIAACSLFVASSNHHKFYGSLLGTILFSVGAIALYTLIVHGQPQDARDIPYAVGFLVIFGLPGLYYVLKFRFSLSSFAPPQADLGEIVELLDQRYAESVSTDERIALMSEILSKYQTYYEVEGGDSSTWSRIASILEEDYEIHEPLITYYRQDHERNPRDLFSMTPLIRGLSVGGPPFPELPGGPALIGGRPGTDWTISFKGTLNELLRVEQQKRRQAMFRSPFRHLHGMLGFFGTLASILLILGVRFSGYKDWLWFLVGGLCLRLIYAHAIKPWIIRRRIQSVFPAVGEFELEVGHEGFLLRTYSGVVQRSWDEVSEMSRTDHGVVIVWADGSKQWLPEHLQEKTSMPEAFGEQRFAAVEPGDPGR